MTIKDINEIIKDMNSRGEVSLPKNCITGSKFEKHLYGEEFNTHNFEKENEIYLNMKNSYPSLLKDSTFEIEITDAIKYIDGQLEECYIDIRDGCCNELSFGILKIAFEEYKQNRNIT